jgi:oligopeptide/dipeptide ABC transporter ATP-binding protein
VSTKAILEVEDLTVSIRLPGGRQATMIEDVSFHIDEGGTLGLVGESGSGKTTTGMAIMGVLPKQARVDNGRILLDGEDLVAKSAREMTRIRGKRMAMMLQDAMTALDPCYNVRSQLAPPLRQHRDLHGDELERELVNSLEQVGLSAAGSRLRQYPHQLSGGMRQRVASAIALSGSPRLLIADEPTSALDATTQVRYLQLLQRLQEESGFGLLFVTHDLMIVRHLCARVIVMYAGQVVEEGAVEDVFTRPQHPYTRALLDAIPTLGEDIENMRLESIEGRPPDITDERAGCRFAARCKFARDTCRESAPELSARGRGARARCWGTEPGGWVEL